MGVSWCTALLSAWTLRHLPQEESAVLPGGRKFRPKSLKGAGEKLSWPEEIVAEFWPNFTKNDRKGSENILFKKIPYLTVLTHFQRQRKILT
jgi:hypothetical protein